MKLFMFVVFAALLMIGLNTASAQIPVSIPFTVSVQAVPLAIALNSDLEVSGLATGQTYTVIPDGAGAGVITPNDGTAAVDAMSEVEISGDINAQVLVSFVLPSRLYAAANGGYVEVSFNNTSAAWGAAGAEGNYFDPHIPTVMTLDGGGLVDVALGGIFKVGSTVAADDYLGEALVTAQYTGL